MPSSGASAEMERQRPLRKLGWRATLDAVSALAMTLASLVVVWAVLRAEARPSPPAKPPRPVNNRPLPSKPIPLGSRTLGNSNAAVALMEFSDYECPFCARFHQASFQNLTDTYVRSGKVLFVLRHLPLEKHAFAFRAAVAAECGAESGRFWEFHGELFKASRPIDDTTVLSIASSVGINDARFRRCLTDGAAGGRIRRDLEIAEEAGVTGTPTFLIGKIQPDQTVKVLRRESGAIPPAALARMLDDALRTIASRPQ